MTIENFGVPCNVKVGTGSYGRIRIYCWESEARISIGRFSSIALVSFMMGGRHHTDVSTFPFKAAYLGQDESAMKAWGAVEIGNDVWIGQDAFILDNVTVGNGAIIAAKSVVTRDVPPYTMVAGNPAQVRKSRFSSEDILLLQESQWWDLPLDCIKNNVGLFYTRDVRQFAETIRDIREELRSEDEARQDQ